MAPAKLIQAHGIPEHIREQFRQAGLAPASSLGAGHKPKGSPRRGRMNETEAGYAREVLDARLAAGEIVGYHFEGLKLRLANGAWYTPDFVVKTSSGCLEFIEIKGFWREAARVRIKVAAELYGWLGSFVSVRRERGSWTTETY